MYFAFAKCFLEYWAVVAATAVATVVPAAAAVERH